jgi:Uma2 family endonuclease
VLPCPIAMPHEATLPGKDGVLVRYRVPGFSEEWVIGTEPVPEAAWHDGAVEHLRALLAHWLGRTSRNAAVFRNLAVRVDAARANVGFDPDLLVVEPAPPGAEDLSSLRLWEPGHAAPSLVVEVVSPGHPYKDYADIPDRCAALGVRELVVFDPLLVGPKALGGARRIQMWRRVETGVFERVAAGEGPFASEYLGGYLFTEDRGRLLRIAEDERGERPWPTPEQSERAQKEQALARVAELERELSARKT